MNCCGNSSEDKKHENKHNNHVWMMALCCGIPLLILLLLPYIRNAFPGASVALGAVVPFLCPVMMIGMMLIMNRSGRNENRHKSNDCHTDGK